MALRPIAKRQVNLIEAGYRAAWEQGWRAGQREKTKENQK